MSKPLYNSMVNAPDGISWAFRQAEKAAREQSMFRSFQIIVQYPKPARTITQNALSFIWYRDAADQGDMTSDDQRAYCKAHIGLEILFEEKPELREKYRSVLGGLSYEQKLACMIEPFDLPVTRMMTKKGMTKYLNAVYTHFTGQGMQLTVPGGEYDWSKYPEAA